MGGVAIFSGMVRKGLTEMPLQHWSQGGGEQGIQLGDKNSRRKELRRHGT